VGSITTFLCLIILGRGCTLEYPQLYRVAIVEHPESQRVQISATTRDDKFDDILSVRFKKKGQDLWLVVKDGAPNIPHPFIHKNNPPGPSFDVSVPITSDIERIIFGKKKTVIWKRMGSAVDQARLQK
jgi:hypothetical protein